jgi:hypothetical protein
MAPGVKSPLYLEDDGDWIEMGTSAAELIAEDRLRTDDGDSARPV